MAFDYYRTLQVDPGAEPEVIEAAYRRLAAKYHPDHNQSQDAEERMKRINEAYDCLSDSRRKADYDRSYRFGRGKSGGEGPRPPFSWLRFLAPLLFLAMTVIGFRVNPRIGLIMAVGFAFYSILRRFRR